MFSKSCVYSVDTYENQLALQLDLSASVHYSYFTRMCSNLEVLRTSTTYAVSLDKHRKLRALYTSGIVLPREGDHEYFLEHVEVRKFVTAFVAFDELSKAGFVRNLRYLKFGVSTSNMTMVYENILKLFKMLPSCLETLIFDDLPGNVASSEYKQRQMELSEILLDRCPSLRTFPGALIPRGYMFAHSVSVLYGVYLYCVRVCV